MSTLLSSAQGFVRLISTPASPLWYQLAAAANQHAVVHLSPSTVYDPATVEGTVIDTVLVLVTPDGSRPVDQWTDVTGPVPQICYEHIAELDAPAGLQTYEGWCRVQPGPNGETRTVRLGCVLSVQGGVEMPAWASGHPRIGPR